MPFIPRQIICQTNLCSLFHDCISRIIKWESIAFLWTYPRTNSYRIKVCKYNCITLSYYSRHSAFNITIFSPVNVVHRYSLSCLEKEHNSLPLHKSFRNLTDLWFCHAMVSEGPGKSGQLFIYFYHLREYVTLQRLCFKHHFACQPVSEMQPSQSNLADEDMDILSSPHCRLVKIAKNSIDNRYK